MIKTWESDLVERQDRANRYLAERHYRRDMKRRKGLVGRFVLLYLIVLVMVGALLVRFG